jgi:hypothetical protein
MIIANLLHWFERVGTARAVAELRRMGYHKEAKALLEK